MSLEIDPGNLSLSYCPPRVTVVVTNAAGEETLCGSLAELLQRVLEQLGVTILAPTPNVVQLDELLSPILEALLQRQVWHFDPGASGCRPNYIIHPTFSDACYRALGSKYFNRLASRITASEAGKG